MSPKAIKDIKGGKVDFRVDKNGNLSFLIGKLSFTEQALDENFKAVADEIKRLKPSTVKGRYVTKATITSTMNRASRLIRRSSPEQYSL